SRHPRQALLDRRWRARRTRRRRSPRAVDLARQVRPRSRRGRGGSRRRARRRRRSAGLSRQSHRARSARARPSGDRGAPLSSQRYAFILAGGLGTRLCLLSERRAKPAVPFAGKYRIIDFTLSNCVNSGIFDVGVLTQYRPTSLHQHIGIGRPWDLDRTRGGVQLLQPFLGTVSGEWYQGTADAIFRNLVHLRRRQADEVLVLSGDHVYKMDYGVLYAFHRANHAAATVAVTEVPAESISAFGILEADESGRVTGFLEKPKRARSRLASMGVYLFEREAMIRWLVEDSTMAGSTHDFGRDLLPRLVQRGERVFAYRFRDYWQDVGTLD